MKIIVRGTNWIGDAVMQIPALREIRRVFPGSHITLCSRKWAVDIFQDEELIDDFLITKQDESPFAQAKKWREGRYDLAILFTNSFQTALTAKLGKVKTRFGYANEGRGFLLTNSIAKPAWKHEKHEIYYYLNLAAEAEKHFHGTNSPQKTEISLEVSSQRTEEARQILLENGADLSKKTIALGVGSTNSRAKRWSSESYAKLNDLLQKELGANVILVGTADELEISSAVFDKSEIKPIILTGKTALSEAIALLSAVDLLVSNDMGLAHLAPAVGTKTLVIFGPTNWKATQPIGSVMIRKDVDCSPCMLRDCPIDHRCMTQISPLEVLAKISALLMQ